MKNSIIKLLSILLIFTQLFCANVLAETIYTEGALNYIIVNGSVVIVDYFGTSPDVTIPSYINNAPVVEIAKDAFTDSKAKTIIIPDTVTKINEGAIPKDIKQEIVSGTTSIYNEDVYQEKDKPEHNEEEIYQEIEPRVVPQEETKDIVEEVDVEEFEIADVDTEIVESGDISIEDQEETESESVVTEHEVETNDVDKSYGYFIVAVVAIALAIVIFKKKKK